MNLLEHLYALVENQSLPHALLFIGKKEAERAAYSLAHFVLYGEKKEHAFFTHPDFHEHRVEGKVALHPLKAIHELIREAALSSYQANWKVFLLHDAERMLPSSANALLKIMEEPPASTLFLFLSAFPDRILSTIRSRMQVFTFFEQKSFPNEVLDLLSHQISKEEFLEKCEEKMQTDPRFFDAFFETILLWHRDRSLLEWGEESSRFLSFPAYRNEIEKNALLPLEKVEKAIGTVKQGLERSLKLSICLDLLTYEQII